MPEQRHNPAPYLAATSMELNTVAAGTAQVALLPDESAPRDIVVTGPCPVCQVEVVHIEPVVLIRGGGSQTVEVICACPHEHPDAPPGVRGCGRSWTLTVEWDG